MSIIKKIILILSIVIAMSMSSCFDIISETTINKDGSGVFLSTSNLGSFFEVIKMMGNNESDSLDKANKDTLISFISFKDSIPGLTETEKLLIEKVTMRVVINASEEEFQMIFTFPFSKFSDLMCAPGLMKKLKNVSMNDTMDGLMPGDKEENNPDLFGKLNLEIADPEDYYDYKIEKGRITKMLNKEKYAQHETDEGLKMVKEMSLMSSPMKLETVYNLPGPAKKAEGKSLTLSGDKKKITISTTLDDFFESPEKLEYTIEY